MEVVTLHSSRRHTGTLMQGRAREAVQELNSARSLGRVAKVRPVECLHRLGESCHLQRVKGLIGSLMTQLTGIYIDGVKLP